MKKTTISKNNLSLALCILLTAMMTSCADNGGKLSDAYLRISPDQNIEFGVDGGTVSIDVETNCTSWELSSDKEWCQVKQYDSKFTVTALPNAADNNMPAALITLTGRYGVEKITKKVNATQCGKNPDLYLNISPDGDIAFEAEGGEVAVDVQTNFKSWTVSSDKEWCRVKQHDAKFTVTALPNTADNNMPAAVITVKGEEGTERMIKTLNVTQKGGVIADLSAAGTSNCYIVGSGTYSFDATVIGNGSAGIMDGAGFHTSEPAIAPVSAGLLWQDAYAAGAGFIASVNLLPNGRVLFRTSDMFEAANAVIAVYDGKECSGNILWSWHIWKPGKPVVATAAETGYAVMNMNVGARTDVSADAGSFGMLYQWGRKDPFPAAEVLAGDQQTVGRRIYDMNGNAVKITYSNRKDADNNTLAYAIANPTVCMSDSAQLKISKDWLKAGTGVDALWGNPNGNAQDEDHNYPNKGLKSIYDPCPAGWRVPPVDVFRRFTSSGGFTQANADDTVPDFNIYDKNGDGTLSIDDYDYGWFFKLNASDHSYFPAAARFDGSHAMLMGSMTGLWGSYWGNAPGGDGIGIAVLSFQVKNIRGNKEITASPKGSAPRADAYSIRCIRE